MLEYGNVTILLNAERITVDGIDLPPPVAAARPFENPTVSDQSGLKFRSLAVRVATWPSWG
jgi:hypothetical protein